MAKFKLAIGVPSGGMWHAEFGLCLVNMMAGFLSKQVPGYQSQEARVINVRSSILSKNRFDLVRGAKAAGCTHLLFLDTDHKFPPDIAHRLAAHGKLVIGANCVTKQIPANPTARLKSESDPKGVPCYSDIGKDGLEEVWRLGTGVMLVNLSVFEKIGLGVWDMKYLPEVDTYQGEDWTFCEALEKAGIPLYVDHKVSREIGHLGLFNYTHDVVGEVVHAKD